MTRNPARPATTRRRAARRPTTGFRRLTVEVLEGRDLPSFAAALVFPAGDSPRAVAVGDFDGDGRPDLAVANSTSNTVSILLGQGGGTFRAPQRYRAGGKSPWS